MKLWTLSVMLVLSLMAAGCGSLLSPEKKTALQQEYSQMLANGQITKTQYDALLSALEGGKDWVGALTEVALSIGGALFGVRLWRGGINDRKGEVGVVEVKP